MGALRLVMMMHGDLRYIEVGDDDAYWFRLG